MLLEADSVSLRYTGLRALRAVSLSVAQGEIVAVLGANGAGKSSLLKALLGLVSVESGRVHMEEVDITDWSPRQRISQGLVLVPEARRLMPELSVEDNLRMGASVRSDRAAVNKEIGAVYERFSSLAARRHMAASVLSASERQILAINRGLLGQPRLMMLDEPSLGLSPPLAREIFGYLRELNREGLTLLVGEQNAGKALSIADRAYVLELGAVVMQGPSRSLREDSRLAAIYLGASAIARG